MIAPTLIWWSESVLWVALMSIYALIKGCDSAHEAKDSQGCPECEHCNEG